MIVIIADTPPVNYLVLIQQPDLLPRLFGQVLIPPAVFEELKERVQDTADLTDFISRGAFASEGVELIKKVDTSRSLDGIEHEPKLRCRLAQELRD